MSNLNYFKMQLRFFYFNKIIIMIEKYKDNDIVKFVYSQLNDTNKINWETKKFKKFGGKIIDNIVEYIKDYIQQDRRIKISIGCDSKQIGILPCTLLL